MNETIDFYEREFYVFSNFSSFMLEWRGLLFTTSEHAYHWGKFNGIPLANRVLAYNEAQSKIQKARSAHDALKIAHEYKEYYRSDWENVKLQIMEEICRAKVEQHPYVKKKLIQSGNRPLVEGSWRDSFWGTGPNGDGENHLGKIWMKIRNDYTS